MNEHSTELKTINFRFLNEFHQKLSIKQLLFQLDLAEKKETRTWAFRTESWLKAGRLMI